ncbi:Hsp20/alpha crystallin family protein [uncultured Methanobrevibacter sp.]|uniref:Hsp20/alpha crystallin family protein n=1 Tax=uncultured Methanobrevibacter sp. TaxID=253161 RepID=UPI0025D78676|nr:Hsp20/alpha crystallin family protein [uncultured Methanobrevibacter sp.]
MANDFRDTKKQAQDAVDDILINLKSAGRSIDNMINEYKETLPNKISVDLLENDEAYYLKANIPGCSKESVNIEIREKSVIIACEYGSFKEELEEKLNVDTETDEEKEENKQIEETLGEKYTPEKNELKYLVKGRTAGTAKRIIKLPDKVIPEESTAKYDMGTVTLTIPKEPQKSYKVTVE